MPTTTVVPGVSEGATVAAVSSSSSRRAGKVGKWMDEAVDVACGDGGGDDEADDEAASD